MANRNTLKSSTVGAITGDDYMDNVAAHLEKLYNAAAFPLTSVGGTGNAITATLDPALTAGLVTGMAFTITWANANTGGVTLSINGASAVPVRDAGGAALASGALTSGTRAWMTYDGTGFRILSAVGGGGGGGAAGYVAITASATFTKASLGSFPDDKIVIVECWGAGGGGSTNTLGGVGGGGGYVRREIRWVDIPSSVTVTIGAGGVKTAAATGNAGGNTTFGSLVTAYGGGGGGSAGGSNVGGVGGGGGALGPGVNGYSINSGANGPGWSDFWGGNGRIYGGGGGGTTSLYGGDGGAASVAGSAPGGGAGKNANGARGEVRIWV